MRQSLAALTRRTLCLAKTKRHLQLRLNAYWVYYNLVREHVMYKLNKVVHRGIKSYTGE